MSRKFRWTFEAEFPAGKIPAQYVKVSSRPNVTINVEKPDEPCKPAEGEEWKPLTTTFFDYSINDTEQLAQFYKVIGSFYNLPADNRDAVPPSEMLGTATLKLLCPKMVYTPTQYKEGPKPLGMGLGVRPGMMGIGMIGGNFHQDGWDMLEEWTFKKIWPKSINFGELDYSNSDECTIEVNWVYNEVLYKFNVPS